MILHIISEEDWIKARTEGVLAPSSLVEDGFIHCSTKEQFIWVANSFFKGTKNLLVLCIDDEKVNAKIVYEDLVNSGKLFPHIYGPLNLDAVYKVVSIKAENDGGFQLPEEID